MDLIPLYIVVSGRILRPITTISCGVMVIKATEGQHQFFEAEKLRMALEAVLAGDECPPPSMAVVARRLQYTHTYLIKLFPDLCRLISERHRGYQQDLS